MSMLGELTFFLGLQVYQIDKGIFISQTKYIEDMLKRFKMDDSKPVSTPIITGCKLSKGDESLEVDHTMYISMIGSMLYVTATRPNVMQAIFHVPILHHYAELQFSSRKPSLFIEIQGMVVNHISTIPTLS